MTDVRPAWRIERLPGRVKLAGELRIADAPAVWRSLRAADGTRAPRLDLELTDATIVDGAVMALLVHLRASLATRGVACEIVERAGNFLVGFVMGFQSSRQLELYGANIFVADIVGISVTRELAPLMTAIIMSGRSGASFAAELGSMRGGRSTTTTVVSCLFAIVIIDTVITVIFQAFGT